MEADASRGDELREGGLARSSGNSREYLGTNIANDFFRGEGSTRPRFRVLLVHNAYQQRGGEDAVVTAEEALLRGAGHSVLRYLRHNDEIGSISQVQLGLQTVWSQRTFSEISKLIGEFRPDILHVHNTLPLISPSVFTAARRAGLPVVQTLHNFRLICPQGLLLRNGKICEDCVGRSPWRAVAHACYRGSRRDSAAISTMLLTHRLLGTWRNRVTLYIALNEFCRDKFIEGGIPAELIRVKPNFVEVPEIGIQQRQGLAFVGRLSREKGVGLLAEALGKCESNPRLRVVGTGPESSVFAEVGGAVLLGQLEPAEVYSQIAGSLAIVVPSIWYENFPRTIVEAFALGVPVIASRVGSLPSLVEHMRTGILFDFGDPISLARAIDWASNHPQEMLAMGIEAKRKFEREWSPRLNLHQLEEIYSEAIARNAGGDVNPLRELPSNPVPTPTRGTP